MPAARTAARWPRPGRRSAALAAVLLAGIGTAVGSSPAFASGSGLLVELPGDPAGWTANPTVAMFGAQNMVPGQSITGTIGVRNTGTGPGLISLAFSGVNGALAGELEYSVGPPGRPADGRPETLAALEQGVVMDPDLAPGATDGYQITVTFPAGAGNQWQGRSTSFDIVWSLTDTGLEAGSGGAPSVGSPAPGPAGETSSVIVAGAGSQASAAPSMLGRLAFTGGAVALPVEIGVAAVVLGSLAVTAARRRRPRAER